MADKRVLSVFTFNCLQSGHWVREDFYTVMNWTHVSLIVQCQSYGCSLSSKDGAVVWQSFAQLAAGCLTFLEMALDDRCCPHSLVHFGAISVNFIMWSLWLMILIELGLDFLYGDHTFAYSFLVGSWVSLGGRPIRHWYLQRSSLPLPWDQWQGPPLPFVRGHTDLWWFGHIHAGHDVMDCQCRHEFWDSNAWITLTYVPPKELHWPLCTDWILGWCRKLAMPVSVQRCERCPVVEDWCLMLCCTQCNCSPAWSVQVSDHSGKVQSLLALCQQDIVIGLRHCWVSGPSTVCTHFTWLNRELLCPYC